MHTSEKSSSFNALIKKLQHKKWEKYMIGLKKD